MLNPDQFHNIVGTHILQDMSGDLGNLYDMHKELFKNGNPSKKITEDAGTKLDQYIADIHHDHIHALAAHLRGAVDDVDYHLTGVVNGLKAAGAHLYTQPVNPHEDELYNRKSLLSHINECLDSTIKAKKEYNDLTDSTPPTEPGA